MTQLTPEALRQLAALWRKYMGNVAGILFSDILCQEADRLDAAKRAETVAAIHAAKDGPFVEVPPGETLSDWLEKDDAAPPLPSQSGAPTSVAGAVDAAKWIAWLREEAHMNKICYPELSRDLLGTAAALETLDKQREYLTESLHGKFDEQQKVIGNMTAQYGFEPGGLQMAWRAGHRTDPRELEAAICDALWTGTVYAWPGDGVSCVAQIVQAQMHRAETLDKRCRLLTTALEGEAVKVSELNGEWRCDMCGAQSEGYDTPLSHQSDCILVGGIRTDGGEGDGT